jgi:methanethiol S-methyltransferase
LKGLEDEKFLTIQSLEGTDMTTTTNNTTESNSTTMGRIATAMYGAVTYTIFFVTFSYAAGFLGNVLVPKSIDSGAAGPFWTSMAINVALLGLFGLQHSVMARPGFKKMWTKIIPKVVERSTYVLATCVCLVLMYWMWQPMPQTIWSVQNPVGRGVMWAICAAGWAIVFFATLMINHFDLFGLRQTFTHAMGKRYTEVGFRVNGFYKLVRHPIMTGFMIAFWATPDMTVGHLLFAVVCTGYIMVGIHFEERDLVNNLGDKYIDYKRQVGGLVPVSKYQTPARETVSSPAMGD